MYFIFILIMAKVDLNFSISLIQPNSPYVAGYSKNTHYKGLILNYFFKENFEIGIGISIRSYDEFYVKDIYVQSYQSSELKYFIEIAYGILLKRKINLEMGFDFGGFTFERQLSPLETSDPLLIVGSYTDFMITPFLNLRFRIPSTNLTVGIKPGYIINIIRNPRKKQVPEYRDFMLSFLIGVIVKE